MARKVLKQKIRLSDGRAGYQRVGDRGLVEVVITHRPNGKRCPKTVFTNGTPDAMARVFSLSQLGNVTWEIVEG